MEKMNQVSVSEFFVKSKEEMYDMAVEMVEKYNRLIDICNDSCERIAKLVIERDNLSKDVQKLIGERDELIERHNVYTSALNKDIADKAAKIDLLEKEIEGRKEGYTALKELMDTKYISIEEHNNICEDFKKKIVKLEKESEKWQDLAKMNRDTICNQYDVCEDFKKKVAELEKELADCKVKIRHQKENLDGINKTLEIRTKENESLIKVRNNLNKEIEAHESENARLSEKIMNLKGTITELSHEIDDYKSWNASLHKDIKELKKEKEDDYGKSGFKRYIEYLIEEEERAVPERFKERLNKEITAIFTKEEETEVKDIPCGEDAIE